MTYNIVRYDETVPEGVILIEGLTRAQALGRAAQMNMKAAHGTFYAIEAW